MQLSLEQQAKDLHEVLTTLVKVSQAREREGICCYGLSVSQCHTLGTLAEHGVLSMGALARHLQLTVSTMTRIVDHLVEREFVQRHVTPTDRRVCCVEITTAGRELVRTIEEGLLATEMTVLRSMAPESRSTLITALQELAQGIAQWQESTQGETLCSRT